MASGAGVRDGEGESVRLTSGHARWCETSRKRKVRDRKDPDTRREGDEGDAVEREKFKREKRQGLEGLWGRIVQGKWKRKMISRSSLRRRSSLGEKDERESPSQPNSLPIPPYSFLMPVICSSCRQHPLCILHSQSGADIHILKPHKSYSAQCLTRVFCPPTSQRS